MKKITDIFLFVLFCALSGTGLGMEFLGRSGGQIHTVLGIGMILFVVIHLVLNSKWLVEVLCKGKTSVAVAGIVAGLILALVFMFALPERKHRHRGPPPQAQAG